MPAVSNLVIKDSAAVAHTFVPIETSATKVVWRTNDPLLPFIAQKTVACSLNKSGNGVYTLRVVIEVPILEQTSGATASGYVAAPKVAYTVKSDLKFHFPERAIQADRGNVRAFLLDALLGGSLNAPVIDLVLPY